MPNAPPDVKERPSHPAPSLSCRRDEARALAAEALERFERKEYLIEAWCRFPVQETTVGVTTAALAARRRFGVSYWDAAVIEAGRALGCAVVLSEDLSPETHYDGVRVENPFAD